MKKGFHIIAKGLAGIGLFDGFCSIYRTNPPAVSMDLRVRSAAEAYAADKFAIENDFEIVLSDVGAACRREMERADVK